MADTLTPEQRHRAMSNARSRNTKPELKIRKGLHAYGLRYRTHYTSLPGKWWRLKYRIDGREKRISLGTYPAVSLKEARKRRDDAKEQLALGHDPSEIRKETRQAAIAERLERENTFEAVAREWYASYSPTLSEKWARYLDGLKTQGQN